MATTKRQTKKHSHALFWTLLKETPGYDPCYKEVIKEGIVHEHSGGRTTSLNEMYENYPSEYSRMIDAMKPKGEAETDGLRVSARPVGEAGDRRHLPVGRQIGLQVS